MAAPLAQMAYDRSFAPDYGRAEPLKPGLTRLTAPNRSPYTFTGTNSFLVGKDRLFVIDPGPDEPAHLAALVEAIGGRRVEAILLTHTHRDHSDLALPLSARLGQRSGPVPIWSGGPHRLSRPARAGEDNPTGGESDWAHRPDRVLADGEVLELEGLRLTVVATPGHSANHLAFGFADDGLLLTGDHVMGWNSTLVSVPEGSMTDYLASLDRVIAGPWQAYHPAHGGPIADGRNYALALRAHRERRNAEVLARVRDGARDLSALRQRIYPQLEGALARAAEMTLAAHADHLAELGLIRLIATPGGMELRPA